MSKNDTNAERTVARRSVLKTMGGLVAGSTALAGLGAGRGAAETDEELQFKQWEATEEYLLADVHFPTDIFDDTEFPTDIFLGHVDDFLLDDDEEWVSLPEDTEGLANPVEMDFDNPHDVRVYFRTEDVAWPKEYEEDTVTLGLGVFTERTIRGDGWDSCPGHRDY